MRQINRRSMLGFSLLGAGAGFGLPGSGAEAAGSAENDRLVIDDTSAVADTESGRVVGYIQGGIRIFKGIPYGEILKPEDRWVRAPKPRPWAGKRSSRAAGPSCPGQDISPAVDEVALRDSDLELTRASEDCLRINVWTPGLDNKKRQVLFYVHGGGFAATSALCSARYEAHNLARHGDVVVVSMNHRLNAWGFLDLSAHGGRWADSANLGMLDVVDALKWVQTNIANFGGDPAKVMIFGHSGGGGKVLTLLAMPEAKGLFSRAVSQSPGPLPLATSDQSAALSAAFLKMVDVAPSNLDALYKLPTQALLRPAVSVALTFGVAHRRFAQWNTPADLGWRPVVDGRSVLYQPTQPTMASDVPLMIGTALHEQFGAIGHPEYLEMKAAEGRARVRDYCGPVGDGMYDIYQRLFPAAHPHQVSAMALAACDHRSYVLKTAQRRAAFHAAPTYNYWIHWQADTFDGRAMSHHEIEMPLVFMNSDAVPTVTGGTAEARALSVKMTDAWLAFARTGNPGTRALPAWGPVTPASIPAMVFDKNCRIDPGSDLAAIELYWKSRFPDA